MDSVKSKAAKEKKEKKIQNVASIKTSPLNQLDIARFFSGHKGLIVQYLTKIQKEKKRLFCFYGSGGMGKLALATQIIDKCLHMFPDAQLLINMKGVKKPLSFAEAMEQVVHAFHPLAKLPSTPEGLTNIYRSVLREQKAVLVFNHVASPTQVKALQPPPNCLMFALSQKDISIDKMLTREIEPLSVEETTELLNQLAPRLQFWIQEIIKTCEYLPLAVVLIGKYVASSPGLDLQAFNLQLHSERKRMETVGKTGVAAGLETALNVIAKNLSDKAGMVFRKLVVFPKSFDSKAEAFVCEDEESDHLALLVDYGLVTYHQQQDRYVLHEMVRDYLKAKKNTGEVSLARTRHATFFLTVSVGISELFEKKDKSRNAMQLFDTEWANIKAGFEFAESRNTTDAAASRLCASYVESAYKLLVFRGSGAERLRWLNSGLKSARQREDEDMINNIVLDLGREHIDQKKFKQAFEYLEEALALTQKTDDKKKEKEVLLELGQASLGLGKYAEAVESFEKELEISRALGDRPSEGNTLGLLGGAYKNLGKADKAKECFEQALIVARDTGEMTGLLKNLNNLASAHLEEGELESAVSLYMEALPIAQKQKEWAMEGGILKSLGQALLDTGKAKDAIGHLERSAVIYKKIRDQVNEGMALHLLGKAQTNSGNPEAGTKFLIKAVDCFQKCRDPAMEAEVLAFLGETYNQNADKERALKAFTQLLTVNRKIGDRGGEGRALWSMAKVLYSSGKQSEAVEKAEEAIPALEEAQDAELETVKGKLAVWSKKKGK